MSVRQKMKIGIDARCLEWNRGGVARILLHILDAWVDVYKDDDLVLLFQSQIPPDIEKRYPNVKCVKPRGPEFFKSRRILCEQILFPWVLFRENLDLFFATWYSAPILNFSTKVIVGAWDISYSTHPQHYSFFNRLSLGIFSKWSCKSAKMVVTCSDYDSGQLQKYYLIPKSKTHVMYLSADQRFRETLPTPSLESVQRKYSLPSKFILSLGVIHNRRNVDKIIQAYSSLGLSQQDIGLVVVGRDNTQPPQNIRSMASALDGVLYIEWVDDKDLPAFYRLSCMYVCTSTVDGESIMLKEAIESGVPVVTSPLLSPSIGYFCEVIENPESVEETKVALLHLLTQSDEIKGQISGGQKFLRQFTWEKTSHNAVEKIRNVALEK